MVVEISPTESEQTQKGLSGEMRIHAQETLVVALKQTKRTDLSLLRLYSSVFYCLRGLLEKRDGGRGAQPPGTEPCSVCAPYFHTTFGTSCVPLCEVEPEITIFLLTAPELTSFSQHVKTSN